MKNNLHTIQLLVSLVAITTTQISCSDIWKKHEEYFTNETAYAHLNECVKAYDEAAKKPHDDIVLVHLYGSLRTRIIDYDEFKGMYEPFSVHYKEAAMTEFLNFLQEKY